MDDDEYYIFLNTEIKGRILWKDLNIKEEDNTDHPFRIITNKEQFINIFAGLIYEENYIDIIDNDEISFDENRLDYDDEQDIERIGMFKLLNYLKSKNKLIK